MRESLLIVVLLLSLLVFRASDGAVVVEAKPDVAQPLPDLILQTGHSKLVEAVAFSPDDKWLASGSFDSTIKIWETETGRELRSLAGHAGAVKALAINPDGTFLASGGNDRSLRVWNVKNGSAAGTYSNNGTIESLVFSSDGKTIASGGSSGVITLRDAVTGVESATFAGHIGSISALAFNPDGSLLASSGSDKSIIVWDVAKRLPSRTLKGHVKTAGVLRFSPDGAMLASGSDDGAIKLWKISNGREIDTPASHANSILGFHFSGIGKLHSADSRGIIKAWAIGDRRVPASAAIGGETAGEGKAAAFTSSGASLAVGNGDGTISLLDATAGKTIRTLQNDVTGFYGVAFSPDRRWLASASFDNTVKLWDLQNGESLKPLVGHTGRVRNVVFHPDGARLISGSADHTIRFWDTLTGRPLGILEGHKGSISSLAIGGKGKYLASGGMDQTVGVWNLESKEKPRFLTGHAGEVISVAIDREEKFIASAGADGMIKLWDAASGAAIRTIDAAAGEVGAVAISPDGKFIASGGTDKIVKLWETETGRLLRTMPGHSAKINTVTFSPDGLRLVSAGLDRNIKAWNVSDGREIQTMSGHMGAVFSATHSGDGRWLASASDDGSISVWKTETGERTATLISIKNSHDWLVVSPQGFFDGSPPSWEQLAWRFENDTFNVKSVEVFFSEFFLPGLLSELINERPMPTSSNISTKDRRQPMVNITADSVAATRSVKTRIDISNAPAGAKDVRLFRNGALVRAWRGDVLKGRATASLDADIPLVAGENRLTAYAFNSDDVKSKSASTRVTGSTDLTRKGISYIVAIGVNEYANADYNLNVASADARDFANELKRQQEKLSNYERVETLVLADKDATKANIVNQLSDLATKIRPEDWVTVFFAGHGIAKDKRFYLVPHDLGYMGSRSQRTAADLQTILDHSISDEEIDRIAERIDARHLLLVIDACNSGQVLESDEKRRGPMNSKGLAHLAYEKGMYILTASQSYQDAKEDARLGHGYLTYALVEEGLKTGVADRLPKDGQVVLREWLDFATMRVPEIDQEEVNKGHKKARRLEREKAKAEGRPDDLNIQRPRVFYRREAEGQPVVSRY